MYISTALVLIITGFLERNEEVDRTLKALKLFAIWTVLFVCIGFNSWTPDYENYEIHFEQPDLGSDLTIYEPVFGLLMSFFRAFELQYSHFLLFCGFVIATLTTRIISLLTNQPLFAFSCYYLSPLFPNIVQTRSCLAFSIGLTAVLMARRRKSLGVIILTFASLIHVGVLPLYILIILNNGLYFLSCLRFLMLFLLIFAITYLIPVETIYSAAAEIHTKYEVLNEIYYSKINTIIYYAPVFLILIIPILDDYKNSLESEKESEMLGRMVSRKDIVTICKYAVLAMPLVLISRDFIRLSLNCLVFAYGYFLSRELKSATIDKWKNEVIQKIKLLSLVAIMYYCLNLHVNRGEYFEVIKNSFESNSMLKWITMQF
jgi:hypothetical protein